jgi:hypothetical protein
MKRLVLAGLALAACSLATGCCHHLGGGGGCPPCGPYGAAPSYGYGMASVQPTAYASAAYSTSSVGGCNCAPSVSPY